MNPRYDRLDEYLEQARLRNDFPSLGGGHDPAEPVAHPPLPDQDIRDLAALAQHLQSSPYLHVDPDFAWRLEQKMLVHQAARERQRTLETGRSPRVARWPHKRRARLRMAVGLALLLLVLCASLLITVVQASNPTSPLSPLYHLVHLPFQAQDGAAAQTKAAQRVQYAQQQLSALAGVTDPAQHETIYQHALAGLQQAIQAANAAVTALPVSTQRERLERTLSALTVQARHVLRALLSQLTLSERQLTTAALGTLGESVPVLQAAAIDVSTPPIGTATITITGTDLEPGAVLLIDGRVVAGSGTFQDGVDVFVVSWTGNRHPQSVGILNLDGTVAQTTTIQVKSAGGANHGKGNNGSGSGGKGSGKGTGKPTSTPTPPGKAPPFQH